MLSIPLLGIGGFEFFVHLARLKLKMRDGLLVELAQLFDLVDDALVQLYQLGFGEVFDFPLNAFHRVCRIGPLLAQCLRLVTRILRRTRAALLGVRLLAGCELDSILGVDHDEVAIFLKAGNLL